MARSTGARAAIAVWLSFVAIGCGGDDGPTWDVVVEEQPGALLSVWGTTADDVWIVGADAADGTGPIVFHQSGGELERVPTGETEGDLWWVYGFVDGPVFMGGSGGLILRYSGGTFEKMATPATAKVVFGLWGASPSDMWAVGGEAGSGGGFAWRLSGDTWTPEPSLPAEVPTTGALWKIHGTSADQAWIVGSNGLSFEWNGSTLTEGSTGVGSSLFTVYGNAERYVAVGGLASGIIVENDGSGWTDATPDPLPDSLTGVTLDGQGGGIAVGFYGSVYERVDAEWVREDLGFSLNENLHGVWIDPDGGVWAAGGNTIAPPLNGGVLLRRN